VRREGCRAHQVAEHDRKLAALGFGSEASGRQFPLCLRSGRRARRTPALGAELGIERNLGAASSAARGEAGAALQAMLGLWRVVLLTPGTLHAVLKPVGPVTVES
jgi:hypothetical protein